MSSMSWSAAVQTERAVGERSLSGRGARVGGPSSADEREAPVRVQRVLSPNGGAESWTVIGDDRRPVAPVEGYLAWLSRIERSPNTVRAYAQDLKTFWEFLEARGLAWDRLTLEQLGLFTAWLRQPADNVVLLAGAEPRRAASTVNRMLSAVMGFYDFHARHGVDGRASAGRSRRAPGAAATSRFWTGSRRCRGRARVGRLREPRRPPRTLTLEQVAAVLDAQRRLRDRFLFALLFGTGMRVGQALGLRHADFVSHERRVEIVAREDNANGARGKGGEGSVPIIRRAGAAALGLHARGVRRAGLRLRVREPVGRPGRAADALRERRRDRRAHPPAGRVSLHGAHVPPHLRDARAPRRRADGHASAGCSRTARCRPRARSTATHRRRTCAPSSSAPACSASSASA